MIMCFSDTLIETDLSFLDHESSDGVAWVKAVPDPRRFGVAEVDENGSVRRLIEKPQNMANNLALVGCYYFRSAQDVISAIEEQMQRDIRLKDEFFLADAINILLERGARMRTHPVGTWLDAGTSDSLLATNRYLLDHGGDNSAQVKGVPNSSIIIPPVYIHPEAEIEFFVIGPYVSISAECKVTSSILRDCIVEEGAHVTNSLLEGSLLGRDVQVVGQALHLNLGDQSWAMR